MTQEEAFSWIVPENIPTSALKRYVCSDIGCAKHKHSVCVCVFVKESRAALMFEGAVASKLSGPSSSHSALLCAHTHTHTH